MQVRILNYDQFKAEKSKILTLINEWKKMVEGFHNNLLKKLSFGEYLNLSKNSDLECHWNKAITAMLDFLEKDIPEEDELNYKKHHFAFFIAEDNGIQGLALGHLQRYQNQAYNFFGIDEGIFFLINDMMISASAMLSRCYPDNFNVNVSKNRIGHNLLEEIIKHVNSLPTQHSLVIMPAHNNDTAKKFLDQHSFNQECGSLGYAYVLNQNKFKDINNIHEQDRLNYSL